MILDVSELDESVIVTSVITMVQSRYANVQVMYNSILIFRCSQVFTLVALSLMLSNLSGLPLFSLIINVRNSEIKLTGCFCL